MRCKTTMRLVLGLIATFCVSSSLAAPLEETSGDPSSIVSIDIEMDDVVMASQAIQDVLGRVDSILEKIESDPDSVSTENVQALHQLVESLNALGNQTSGILDQVPQSIEASQTALLSLTAKASSQVNEQVIQPTISSLKQTAYVSLTAIMVILLLVVVALILLGLRMAQITRSLKDIAGDYRIVHVTDQAKPKYKFSSRRLN